MKAMLLGFLAVIAIGYGAWFTLNSLELTTAATRADGNVRLD